MDKQNVIYIHTTEYNSAIKKTSTVHATTRINLENLSKKKPDTEGHIFYMYVKYPGQANSQT